MIGPYRVAARACARIGDYQRAAEILDQAFARFPDNSTIAAERREAHDLRLGLEKKEIAGRGYIPQVQSNFSSPLPEVIQLPAFHREVAAALLELIVELHRNPLRMMRDQSYVEADFRDAAVHRLSARWANTHAEPIAATGFADLVVSSDSRAESFVSEFKIWVRNDYLHATEQVIGYSGLRDPAVAIVMVNPNQEDITSAYVEQLIIGHPSYIPASYRRRPLEPQSERLTHFLSRHRDPLGRSVIVFPLCLPCGSFEATQEESETN